MIFEQPDQAFAGVLWGMTQSRPASGSLDFGPAGDLGGSADTRETPPAAAATSTLLRWERSSAVGAGHGGVDAGTGDG